MAPRHLTALLALLGGCGAPAPDDDDAVDCTSTTAARVGCVDSTRLWDDVGTVSGPRTPGSAHWQEVQDLCAARFAAAGFEVERHDYGSGVNVVGRLAGAGDAWVVAGAHYDAVPGCDGADDNATGVAAVLEVARVLGGRSSAPAG